MKTLRMGVLNGKKDGGKTEEWKERKASETEKRLKMWRLQMKCNLEEIRKVRKERNSEMHAKMHHEQKRDALRANKDSDAQERDSSEKGQKVSANAHLCSRMQHDRHENEMMND